MKRIFIAVKVVPGNTFLSMISSLKAGLKNENIRWIDQANTHLTIAFLGDTPDQMIITVIGMMKARVTDFSKFELVISGAGVFRSLKDPRILWTGIARSDELLKLNVTVVDGLKGIGIELEDRPFNPHLTLGRIKNLKDISTLKTLMAEYQNSVIQKVFVEEVILYESILLPSGPVYKPVHRFALQ
jgi:2'-5' RNA ligase